MPDPSASPEQRILDAALETIAEHNISGTRMRLIAEKAGMSQGNLHYYFDSKEDLFQALLDAMLEGFVSERQQEVQSAHLAPAQTLAVFFAQDRKILQERSKTMRAFFDFWVQAAGDATIRAKVQALYQAWRADIARVVAGGVEQGQFSAEHSKLVPALMVSLMDGMALQYLLDPQALDLQAYLDVAYEMILRLLQPERD